MGRSQTTLRRPRRCDVLIVDSTGADELRLMSLGGLETTVLYTRREVFSLAPVVLLRFVWNTITRLGDLTQTSLPGGLYRIYLLACVQSIRPRVAVTLVDNSLPFQYLATRYKSARFVAVQNGLRYPANVSSLLPPPPQMGSVIRIPLLLCFGRYEIDLYRRFGHAVDEFLPLGSLRGAWYRTQAAPAAQQARDGVCLVSEWEPGVFDAGPFPFPDVAEGIRAVTDAFAAYVQERGISACVALRSSDPRERAYYEGVLGGSARIVDRSREMSTYRAMDESRVSVSFASTATTEAFGWGAKVLVANLAGAESYDFPVPGPWAVSAGPPDSFAGSLDRLLEMSDEEYEELSRSARAYLMNYLEGRPPHLELRRIVLEALGKDPRRPEGDQ